MTDRNPRETGISRRDFLRFAGIASAAALLPGQLLASVGDKTVAKDFSPAYGIIPPMVTPFTRTGSIDWNALDHLVEWHIDRGVSGLFVVCGSGEMYDLTPDEALAIASRVVKRSSGRINVFATSSLKRRYAQVDENIALTKRMAETGVTGCFITLPSDAPTGFWQPMDDSMVAYFRKIHDGTNCPLYIYENPMGRQSYKFSPDAMAEIGGMERYISVKDTSTIRHVPRDTALAPIKAKLEAVGDSFRIMQADPKWFLESLKLGCSGGINITANVAPSLHVELYRAFKKGDMATAVMLQDRIFTIEKLASGGSVKAWKIFLKLSGLPMLTVTRSSGSYTKSPDNITQMLEIVRKAEADLGIHTPVPKAI
jgi:4-hydroxy-tetrahydrodipicolinate synthase